MNDAEINIFVFKFSVFENVFLGEAPRNYIFNPGI